MYGKTCKVLRRSLDASRLKASEESIRSRTEEVSAANAGVPAIKTASSPLRWWDPSRRLSCTTAGVTLPVGEVWDPLELASAYDKDSGEESLAYRRYLAEAERKHGRLAMVAFLGIIFGEHFGFLFDGSATATPAVYQFDRLSETHPLVRLGVLWLITMAEVQSIMRDFSAWRLVQSDDLGGWTYLPILFEDRAPGDCNFDPLNIKPKNEEMLLDITNKEINNGRLAMIGVIGAMAQEYHTHQALF